MAIPAKITIKANYSNQKDIKFSGFVLSLNMSDECHITLDMSPYNQKQLFDQLRGLGKEADK